MTSGAGKGGARIRKAAFRRPFGFLGDTRRAADGLRGDDSRLLVGVDEAAQLLGAAGMAQFAQGLGFDLANAFARDVKLLADFL